MTDQMVAESVEMRAIEDVEWYGFAVIEDAIERGCRR